MTAPGREVTGTGAGPATLDLALDAGSVRVHLAEQRPAPPRSAPASSWTPTPRPGGCRACRG